MPGFGKSGTWRILAFRASVTVVSVWKISGANLETARAARGCEDRHLNGVYASAGGATANGTLEALDRLTIALDLGLHPPVLQVAHVPVQAFTARGIFCEEAKAHALDPAADDEVPGNDHDWSAIIPDSELELILTATARPRS